MIICTRPHGLDNTPGPVFVLRLCFNRRFMTAFASIRATKLSHINKYQHRLHVCEVFRCFYCSSHHKAQSATQLRMVCLCYAQTAEMVCTARSSRISLAFGNCFSLSLNACFVLFWNCLLVLVSLGDGTHWQHRKQYHLKSRILCSFDS